MNTLPRTPASPANGAAAEPRGMGVLLLLSLLLLAALVRLPALAQPWGGDQAVYGYIGWRMMDGEVPYRDLYSSTGYGIFFTNMWAMQLFGKMMLSAHLLDAIGYLLTVALLYLFSARLFDRPTAAIGCILFILMMNGKAYSFLYEGYSAFGTYWYLCQRESFQTLLGIAAVALVYLGEERNRPLLHLLAGVLIGLSIVYKLTGLMIFGFAGLYILFVRIANWRRSRRPFEWLLLALGWLAIPLGTVLAHLPFLWYFREADSLETMLKAVFEHTKIYAGLSRNLVVENVFGGHAAMFYEQFSIWIFAALGALVLLRFRPDRRTWLVVGWAFFSLLMVWMQKKFFGYHFVVMSAPLGLLAAVGLRLVLSSAHGYLETAPWTANRPVRLLTLALLVFNLVLFGALNASYYWRTVRYVTGIADRAEYEHNFSAYPKHMYSVPADRAVADFITDKVREQNIPDPRLEIVNGGGENLIHFLAGITPYSRFTSTWYLLVPDLYDEPYTSELRRQFVDTVREERPAFLLFVLEDVDFYSDETHADVKEFIDFVRSDYRKVATFPDDRFLYMPVEWTLKQVGTPQEPTEIPLVVPEAGETDPSGAELDEPEAPIPDATEAELPGGTPAQPDPDGADLAPATD